LKTCQSGRARIPIFPRRRLLFLLQALIRLKVTIEFASIWRMVSATAFGLLRHLAA
jgi:hypothetical protein